MLIKTRGIVFHSFKYSETSVIVEIYTEAKGLQKYIIAGVRTSRSKISAGLLQITALVEIVAYYREDKELNRIKEIKPAFVYQKIPFDVYRGAIGLFILEVARKVLKQAEQNEALFLFLLDSLILLDRSEHSIANLHLSFLLKFSEYLGFAPSGEYSPQTPYFDLQEGIFIPFLAIKFGLNDIESSTFSHLIHTTMEDAHDIKLHRQQRNQILHYIIQYFQLHLDNFPEIHAHQVLQEIFS